MIFCKGFIYRSGVRIKEFGERIGHVRIFGILIFRLIGDPAIGLGCKIKDSVLSSPIGEI
ncbi:hypothetical protein FACS189468_7380 [Spirochaetia bacterium]|nr:hypothetical protein FACS189468_7380 [Spirochaetia bacterium]